MTLLRMEVGTLSESEFRQLLVSLDLRDKSEVTSYAAARVLLYEWLRHFQVLSELQAINVTREAGAIIEHVVAAGPGKGRPALRQLSIWDWKLAVWTDKEVIRWYDFIDATYKQEAGHAGFVTAVTFDLGNRWAQLHAAERQWRQSRAAKGVTEQRPAQEPAGIG